jgi:hypothetical protein
MPASQSFTQRVLAELAPHVPPLRCCRTALIEGMVLVSDVGGSVSTTRAVAARAAVQALHASGLPARASRLATPRRHRYRLSDVDLSALAPASSRPCCARSRLRGAFLAAGRLTRADSVSHLELSAPLRSSADRLADDLSSLEVVSAVRRHRGGWLVTVRSAAAVGAALSSSGAQGGRLEFEAGRVVRELRGGVNRHLNAETANLRRSASAGVRQVAAVGALEADARRWTELPAALREAAMLRRRHPDDDLAALAARAGCSRSAMAGRLRRLLAAASGVSVHPRNAGRSGEHAWL